MPFTDSIGRRAFLGWTAQLAAITWAAACTHSDSPAAPPVTVGPDLSTFAQTNKPGACAAWSWLTAVAIVLDYYNCQTTQETVSFGIGSECPTGTNAAIVKAIGTGPFLTQAGFVYLTTTPLFDAADAHSVLSLAGVVAALADGIPLLYCNTDHVHVLYQISYTGPASNPTVTAATVIDPATGSIRTLTTSELLSTTSGGQAAYVAKAQVVA